MKYLSKHLLTGILLEVLVLIISFIEANGDVVHFFQAAARLSGRISLLYFAILFVYSTLNPSVDVGSKPLYVKTVLSHNFLILHVIHFFLLATAARLSGFPVVPYRLTGGALAYLMVALYPFILHGKIFTRMSKKLAQHIYLNYVWLIFLFTYLSRVSGKALNVTGDILAYQVLFGITITLMLWRIVVLIRRIVVK